MIERKYVIEGKMTMQCGEELNCHFFGSAFRSVSLSPDTLVYNSLDLMDI